MDLYFPLPFLLPIFKGGKKKMKRSTYQPELETLNALREQIMAPFLNLEAVLKDKEANVRVRVYFLRVSQTHTSNFTHC